MKERGTVTEPPPRASFSASANQVTAILAIIFVSVNEAAKLTLYSLLIMI